jgi:hypothetical protein
VSSAGGLGGADSKEQFPVDVNLDAILSMVVELNTEFTEVGRKTGEVRCVKGVAGLA